MKTFWTTFYSYKGGVGRSLALANIAALLVQRGRRVLLIDFDLEAPGLDSFGEFSVVKSKPGVIEYTSQFINNKRPPDIQHFVYECPLNPPSRGKLWIMPAGCKDHMYHRQLQEINWIKLYDEGIGGPFIENWKAAIEDTFKPDFVLIDSRTGITEIGGICTVQFPDLVVMLFGLNEQNLRGTHSIAKAIIESKADRIPQISYVATPIPSLLTDQQDLLRQRLDAAANLFGTDIKHFIRYYAPAALEEKLFVNTSTNPEPPIIQDYRNLEKRIIELNNLGLDFLLKESKKAIKDGDDERINGLFNLLQKDFSDEPEALCLQSDLKRQLGEPEDSIALAEEAFAKDPSYLPSFEILERYYKRKKEPKKIADLCAVVLSQKNTLLPYDEYKISVQMGEYLMEAGLYGEANLAYEKSKIAAIEAKESLLPSIYNIAESRRRFTNNIFTLDWEDVISTFESTDISSYSLNVQASQLHAMHIPYALVGNLDKAFLFLDKADHIASGLNEASTFFTPKLFRWIIKNEFIKINKEMQIALRSGHLWDETKILPPKQ